MMRCKEKRKRTWPNCKGPPHRLVNAMPVAIQQALQQLMLQLVRPSAEETQPGYCKDDKAYETELYKEPPTKPCMTGWRIYSSSMSYQVCREHAWRLLAILLLVPLAGRKNHHTCKGHKRPATTMKQRCVVRITGCCSTKVFMTCRTGEK